jgi:hypothetical protein
MNIPSFINPSKLTISRAQRANLDGGFTMEMTAADPEGDTITVSKWTEDTGNTMVTPDTRFTTSYQETGKKPIVHERVSEDEAYELSQAFRCAQKEDEIDNLAVTFLIADLNTRGGTGSAVSLGGIS